MSAKKPLRSKLPSDRNCFLLSRMSGIYYSYPLLSSGDWLHSLRPKLQSTEAYQKESKLYPKMYAMHEVRNIKTIKRDGSEYKPHIMPRQGQLNSNCLGPDIHSTQSFCYVIEFIHLPPQHLNLLKDAFFQKSLRLIQGEANIIQILANSTIGIVLGHMDEAAYEIFLLGGLMLREDDQKDDNLCVKATLGTGLPLCESPEIRHHVHFSPLLESQGVTSTMWQKFDSFRSWVLREILASFDLNRDCPCICHKVRRECLYMVLYYKQIACLLLRVIYTA